MKVKNIEILNERGERVYYVPSNVIKAFRYLIRKRKNERPYSGVVYLKITRDHVNLIYTDALILTIVRFPHYLENPVPEEGVIGGENLKDNEVIVLQGAKYPLELERILSLFPAPENIVMSDEGGYYFLNPESAGDLHHFFSLLGIRGLHYFVPVKDLSFYHYYLPDIEVFALVLNYKIARKDVDIPLYEERLRHLKQELSQSKI